jgi:hypothetical protein
VAQVSNKKLGRKAVVTDSRTMRLSKYFTAALPPPPPGVSYSKGLLSWGQMLNDQLGDCTCAGIGHGCQVWGLNSTGKMPAIPDSAVLQAYEQWCGYSPSDPSTDQGGICLNVLKDFKAQGFSGDTLTAFASVLPANEVHVKQAIYLFTGLYIGMDVPQYIMPDSGNVPGLWDVNPNADNTIIGGHCVYVLGYNAVGPLFISWGGLYRMTWKYWSSFVDEAYALISKNYLNAKGLAPSGFSLDALETDLVNIG